MVSNLVKYLQKELTGLGEIQVRVEQIYSTSIICPFSGSVINTGSRMLDIPFDYSMVLNEIYADLVHVKEKGIKISDYRMFIYTMTEIGNRINLRYAKCANNIRKE